ncbi:MAG: response regulator [Firmicutes bacterium]|nr:response regulator [Bacillota bacterium]
MLRITLIDDEPSALKNMEHILSELPHVWIAGMYTAPEPALAAIEEDRPDAVFVDIEMPGKNGLELAEELADRHPKIRVVFVTAYNQYAIAAFEASAVDYLLKPVRKERLEKTLARLVKNEEHEPVVSERDQRIKIQCFGKFEVSSSAGAPLSFRTRKTEELMALLIHLRHKVLSREKIIEALWPKFDAEKAGVLFHTTLYNLKKAIGELGGGVELKKIAGGYSLRLSDAACDAEELEKRLADMGRVHDRNIDEYEEALSLYTGAYFEEDGYQWADGKRLELQNVLAAACMDMALYYEGKALPEKAADAVDILLRIDDMNEAAYETLIRCCRRMGSTGRMLGAYDRYWSVMKELGLPQKSLENICE